MTTEEIIKEKPPKYSYILEQSMTKWMMPVDIIRVYYGDKTSIYFEWMNQLFLCLIPAAIFSSVTFVMNTILH